MTGTLPGLCVFGSLGLSPFSTLLLIGVGLLLELGLTPVTFRQTTGEPIQSQAQNKDSPKV